MTFITRGEPPELLD